MFLRDVLNLLGSAQFKDDFLKWFPDTNIEKFEAARDPYNKDLQVLLQVLVRPDRVSGAETIQFWLMVEDWQVRLVYTNAELGSGAIGWKLFKASKFMNGHVFWSDLYNGE